MSKPKPCRYERTLGYRATKGEHADDCTDPTGHHGCLECLHRHCAVCGRAHTDDQHPQTCASCVGSMREDLAEIAELCRGLRRQAVDAEGLSWASARIPGATAMVLMGPSVDPDDIRRTSAVAAAEHVKTHRRGDPIPPLTVLARWEEVWAGWFGQTRARTSITRAVAYLDEHLTRLAQTSPGWVDGILVTPPEFTEFARDIGRLRAQLERVLHDESDDEGGISCFECGHQLVRRIRDPRRCRHKTPARVALAERLRERQDPAAWLDMLRSYGLPAWPDEIEAARLPSPIEVAAARLPCERCDQGGLADPTPGVSWECPSCRMRYTPGEYANAVRRDLADRKLITGEEVEISSVHAYGWTNVTLAAAAASTLVGYPVSTNTLRAWMEREKVSWCCAWTPGQFIGQRLVFWPDVAEQAAKASERAQRNAAERSRLAYQRHQWRVAVEAGEDPDEAARRLEIHPARAARFEAEWDAERAVAKTG